MGKQRLSFDMDVEDHRYVKMCCAKLGISLKDFIISATIQKVEEYEDRWMFEHSFEDNEGDNHTLIDHDGQFHAL
ncbi:MAG: hypothetical protein H0T62_13810 [Parachlamydiaceae bacterium]|nr:hypothetical protein [Parachlamydiaceae bacterium]